MARQLECDVLVMVDSDMFPDMYVKESGAKPFFQSSFDFLVSHYPQGDWRIGAPFYFCALLQVASLLLAVLHLRRHHHRLAIALKV